MVRNTHFKVAGYIGYALLFLSVLVILYWLLGFVPEGRASTKANTGLCFLLLAIQLIINAKRQNQLSWYHFSPTVFFVVIASLSFIENLFGVIFSIDHLLVGVDQDVFSLMASGTAVSFIFLGMASFLIKKKSVLTDHTFAVMNNLVQIIVLIAIISHIFAPLETSKPTFWSTMSILTCFLFLVASVGLSALRPDIGFIRVLLSKELNGVVARRMVIIIMLAALVLGSVLYYFYQRQVLSLEFRFVFLITLSIVLALCATAYLEILIRKLEHDRRMLTEELKDTLEEKDELLKELHHRIKNNLQLISSLMYIQANNAKDDSFKHFLTEINGRIQAIYTIHEFLLQRKVTNSMNVREYLTLLSRQLIASYSKTEKKFDLELSCVNAEMDPDLAFNIGIIFNETILCLIKNPLIPQSYINVSLETDNSTVYLTFIDCLPDDHDKFLDDFRKSPYFDNLGVFVDLLKGKLDYELNTHLKIYITLTGQTHLLK
ncbi:MAG: sensor histidine kinase [Cyclobacteriaceae bacterium]